MAASKRMNICGPQFIHTSHPPFALALFIRPFYLSTHLFQDLRAAEVSHTGMHQGQPYGHAPRNDRTRYHRYRTAMVFIIGSYHDRHGACIYVIRNAFGPLAFWIMKSGKLVETTGV